MVGATRPGTKVLIQIWRKGANKDLSIIVGEILDEKVATKALKNSKTVESAANRLGLVLSELTEEQKRELKVDGGLFIEDIRSNVVRADLRTRDVILALISRGISTEIKSIDQFNKMLAQLDKSAHVTLLIRRGEVQTFVTIKGLADKKSD
jgi:serine protease Do